MCNEASIGDSQSLVLVYRIKDEVDNISSDWSMRTFVDVEVDPDSPAAPAIIAPRTQVSHAA